MVVSAQRWSAIAESEFDWEREALGFLRNHLPDVDPWHVWSNFEFIDDQGRVNEVDALVLSPRGLFLVEIKSRPGRVEGDAHSWTWLHEGRASTYDNPYLLANRKAKRLKSLLQRQEAFRRARISVPFVTAAVFLSSPTNDLSALPPSVAANAFNRGRPGTPRDEGIIAALSGVVGPGRDRTPNGDPTIRRAMKSAMETAGIRRSLSHRRVGDYELEKLIEEGGDYQDYLGLHVAAGVRRRIRIFQTPPGRAREDVFKAVAREFQILEGVNHPGILRASDFKDTERGPALVFEFDPKAVRLDFILKEKALVDRLDVDQRLHLVRQLAETIRYAHEKRLTHRALVPQNVLVRDIGERLPRLQVMNWQLAAREAGSTGGTLQHTLGTVHLDDHVDDPAKVYMAPEALQHAGPPVLADIFSLGAIAYHVFSGQPPATSTVELVEKLRHGQGLMVVDVMDGASADLVNLIRQATHPDVSRRLDSTDEFLALLAKVEEATGQTEDQVVDPGIAKAGDRLDGGFTVIRRLGRGSSADALLVQRDDSEEQFVLKVAIDSAHSERLAAEGEVIARLGHQNIVRHRQTLTVSGRTALLMEQAGDETLAARLRRGERPSLDLARRWGEDLISAIDYLDEQGIAHRDIKPDNIGIRSNRKSTLHLVLFDFSLSRGSLDNIRAGTRPYLDPFLSLRRPPRWDLHAERFAVAMTLYEMLTGSIPIWGDGASEPAVLDCEVTLEAERFDPQARDTMVAFFERALRRSPAERFDNAEEMLKAWRQIFDDMQPTTVVSDDSFDVIARRVTAQTPVAELGLGVEALDVLTRMGVETVRQLLGVPRIKLRYLSGVGDRIRKEIRLKAKRLAHLRPELVPGGTTAQDEAPSLAGSIDNLAASLLPKRPLGEEAPDDEAVSTYLGLEEAAEPWLGIGAVANRTGLSRVALAELLREARGRWQNKDSLAEVRRDLARLLDQEGRVVTATEAARALLLQRGSLKTDDEERLRLAQAVVRAAVDAEEMGAEPRFRFYSTRTVPMIAADATIASAAIALAEAADDLATLDPLASPQRVRERLDEVAGPDLKAVASPQRLVRLAVALASKAALSTRQEIYPRAMPAEQAIRLALSSLMGPTWLSREQICERVHSRYPEAQPLPDRPDLDRLLKAAGAELEWRGASAAGPAGFWRKSMGFDPSGSAQTQSRLNTFAPPEEESPDLVEARKFEDKLSRVIADGGFLALSMAPKRALATARELESRWGMTHLSIDSLLLKAMKAAAEANDVEWLTVRETDAAGSGAAEWRHLKNLAEIAWPQVEETIRAVPGPVLLTDAGLLGRYDLVHRLDVLRGHCGRAEGLAGLIVLVPMMVPGQPAIEGKPVPVMPTQWAMVPDAWVENRHRAGRAA